RFLHNLATATLAPLEKERREPDQPQNIDEQWPIPVHAIQAMRRTSRAGNANSAQISSSTPPTATPTIRNGSNISHTMGYSTNASMARGQQKNRSMHHSRNLIMIA